MKLAIAGFPTFDENDQEISQRSRSGKRGKKKRGGGRSRRSR